MKRSAYSAVVLALITLVGFIGCGKLSLPGSGAASNGTKSSSTEAPKFTTAKGVADLRTQLLTNLADPNSEIYADPAKNRQLLRDMAANHPESFQLMLAKLNALRFQRGLPELNEKSVSGASLRLVDSTSTAKPTGPDTALAQCMNSKLTLPTASLSLDAAPDAAGAPVNVCPDSCVCAAAFGVAEGWASGWGYGFANASCSDGTTVHAEAFATAQAHAYAFAYAFAIACAEPAAAGVCDGKGAGGGCDGIAANPMVEILADFPACIAGGPCGVPTTAPGSEPSGAASEGPTPVAKSTDEPASPAVTPTPTTSSVTMPNQMH